MTEPLPFRMTLRSAERLIRSRAVKSECVIVTDHAEERMVERGITLDDALVILRRGFVYVEPYRNDHGEWQAEIERRMPGGRDVAVITVIPQGEMVIVRTVMWRDER